MLGECSGLAARTDRSVRIVDGAFVAVGGSLKSLSVEWVQAHEWFVVAVPGNVVVAVLHMELWEEYQVWGFQL